MSSPEELEKKKKSWEKYDKALDKMIFKGKADKLLNNIIDDFTVTPDKKPGISLGTIFKAAKFFFKSPKKTLDLIDMARSGTLQDPDFQKHLLSKKELWDTVETKTPELLPKIGKMLQSSGVPEFQPGNILDADALKNIATSLGNKNSLLKVQEIVQATFAPEKNWQNIAEKGLKLLAGDDDLSKYAKTRGEAIGKYVANKLTQVTSTDIMQKLANIKKDNNDYKNANLLNDEKFLNKFSKIIANNINNKNTPEKQEAVNMLPELRKIPIKEQQQIIEIAKTLTDTTKPALQEAYGITSKEAHALTKIIPALLKEPKDLVTIFDSFKTGDYAQTTVNLLSITDRNPAVKEFFKESRDAVVEVLDNVVKNSESLKKMNLKGDIYDIIPQLIEHPKELISIIKCQETKEYERGAKEFLKVVADDPKIQKYFENKGETLVEIGKKIAGLDKTEIKNEIGQVFGLLMKGENAKKIQKLVDNYQKQEYTQLISSTCKMLEEDPQFAKYLQNNKENFSKVIEAVVDKSPSFKARLMGLKIGDLAATILEEPKATREIVESYDKGGVIGGIYQATKTLATNENLRNATGNTLSKRVTDLVYGNKTGEAILNEIASKDHSKQLNLNEFVQNKQNSNATTIQEKQTIIALNEKNDLFNNMQLGSNTNPPLKLENIRISEQQFINNKIENVSFKNTTFEKVAFNNSEMKNVNLEGSSIDGKTLETMLPNIKNNNISLAGVKITGSLNGIDLEGISLKETDLSKITSMDGTNFKGTIIQNTKLPEDRNIITKSFNLDKVKDEDNLISKDMKSAQRRNLVDKITDTITRSVAANDLGEPMDKKRQEQFKNKLNSIIDKDDKLAEYLVNNIQSDPSKILNNDIVIKQDKVNNVADYKGTKYVMDTLIKNRFETLDNLKNNLGASMLAEQVTEKLFGEGKNRGKDGLLVRSLMQEATKEFTKDNPNIDVAKLAENSSLVDKIHKEIFDKSNYTLAGHATGGIQLKPEIVKDKFLISDIAGALEEKSNPQIKLTEKEQAQIADISKSIGHNLFDKGVENNRKEDVKIIENSLNDAFTKVKSKSGLGDISSIIEKNKEAIIGNQGQKNSLGRTGLTETFYEGSSYTKAGLFTGGIQLTKSKIESKEFTQSLNTSLENMLHKDIKEVKSNKEKHAAIEKFRNNSNVQSKCNITPQTTNNTKKLSQKIER